MSIIRVVGLLWVRQGRRMLETTLALILFLFPLAYSPGPGNLFFAANGARFGAWSTVPATSGYHMATWLVTAAIGFGFLSALEQFPGAFKALQIGGAAYVFWIAWKLLRAGVLRGEERAKPATFLDGVVLLILNPKAYVIIALMFTQFLNAAGGSSITAILLITTVFTLNNLVAFSAWTIAGDALGRLFRTPEYARRLNVTFGLLLAGVALWMLVA